jgi:mono/diheme cytochrome c family protein
MPILSTLISTPKRLFGVAAVALLAITAGCTYSQGPEPSPCNDPRPATYAAVISPIFDTHCRECHGATVYQTLGGGNDYSTLQGIKLQSANKILASIRRDPNANPMPKGRDKISECDIAAIQAWIAAGQPDN